MGFEEVRRAEVGVTEEERRQRGIRRVRGGIVGVMRGQGEVKVGVMSWASEEARCRRGRQDKVDRASLTRSQSISFYSRGD